MVALHVTPKSSLVDDPLQVEITGLMPAQEVTLVTWLEESKMKFMSTACFTADMGGNIDISKSFSFKGTYTGVEPMGLIWSMKPAPGQPFGIRLKKSVSTPYIVHLSVLAGHVEFEESFGAKNVICSSKFERFYKDERVQRIKVREGRIRGALFVPTGRGPFPGVIDIFGATGGIHEFRSALLASRGFCSLVLPFYRYEDLPETFHKLDMTYFEEAIDWFTSLPFVARESIGLNGSSLGANIVLYLSTLLPKIKAVVTVGPSHFSCEIDMVYKDTVLKPDTQAYDFGSIKITDNLLLHKGAFVGTPNEDSVYKIEKSSAHFLFIHGGEDTIAPAQCSTELVNRLKSRGKTNYKALIYPGAGHLIEPPYSTFSYVAYHPVLKLFHICGGNMRQHAQAQEDAWNNVLEFLRFHLTRPNETQYKNKL